MVILSDSGKGKCKWNPPAQYRFWVKPIALVAFTEFKIVLIIGPCNKLIMPRFVNLVCLLFCKWYTRPPSTLAFLILLGLIPNIWDGVPEQILGLISNIWDGVPEQGQNGDTWSWNLKRGRGKNSFLLCQGKFIFAICSLCWHVMDSECIAC